MVLEVDLAKTCTAIALLRKFYPEYDSDRLQAFFACKNVFIDDVLVTQPQLKVSTEAFATISLETSKYVSRGGLKLEKALKDFAIDVKDLVMLDAGSSTGGFTDCLLQSGAKCVHSVDVGYNQLDFSLRKNPKVVVHERQNIMTLESLDPQADAAVADLSFRSISGAASHILSLVKQKWVVALIKPQFEMPKWEALNSDFDGIVKEELLLSIMLRVRECLLKEDTGIYKLTLSPIKGHKGNVEFLALLKPEEGMSEDEMKQKVLELLKAR